MKEYELTVLFNPDFDAAIDAPLASLKKLLTDNGGEIIREENWGKKKLAYAINGENFAVYINIDVALPAPALLKISNTLNITEGVLRYLLTKIDEKERAGIAEAAEQAARRATDRDNREYSRNDDAA